METTLAEVIKKYKDEVPIAHLNRGAQLEALQKKLNCIHKEMKELNHSSTEKEILSYLARNLISGEWEDAVDWITAIMHHPSSNYLEYLLKILKTEYEKGPYYWVLDVIQCMPEEMTDPILPDLKALADPINPVWIDPEIEKYFETIAWIDEDAEAFFFTLQDSPSELVAYRAKYWLETYEAERMED